MTRYNVHTVAVLYLQPAEKPNAAAEVLAYTKAVVKPRLAYQGRGETGVKLGTVRTCSFRSPALATVRPRSKPRLCEVAKRAASNSPVTAVPPAVAVPPHTNTVIGLPSVKRANTQVCCVAFNQNIMYFCLAAAL